MRFTNESFARTCDCLQDYAAIIPIDHCVFFEESVSLPHEGSIASGAEVEVLLWASPPGIRMAASWHCSRQESKNVLRSGMSSPGHAASCCSKSSTARPQVAAGSLSDSLRRALARHYHVV